MQHLECYTLTDSSNVAWPPRDLKIVGSNPEADEVEEKRRNIIERENFKAIIGGKCRLQPGILDSVQNSKETKRSVEI